ncbi:hypothetical protein EAO70_35775 [Streptomyces sp. adm13(2018)]|nr:hypothetical protein EAO70_35775 [Streptomyces sp. adm13(2018)]
MFQRAATTGGPLTARDAADGARLSAAQVLSRRGRAGSSARVRRATGTSPFEGLPRYGANAGRRASAPTRVAEPEVGRGPFPGGSARTVPDGPAAVRAAVPGFGPGPA